MDKFWQLLADSVITQGLITLTLILTTCYLVVFGRAVPAELWAADGLVIGYFFGAKQQQFISRLR